MAKTGPLFYIGHEWYHGGFSLKEGEQIINPKAPLSKSFVAGWKAAGDLEKLPKLLLAARKALASYDLCSDEADSDMNDFKLILGMFNDQ